MSKNEKQPHELPPLTEEQLSLADLILLKIEKIMAQSSLDAEVDIGWSEPPTSAW